jgi:hypothetical protein
VKFGGGVLCDDSPMDFAIRTGGEHVHTRGGAAVKDLADLLGRFSTAENDLGEPAAQRAVMIDFGEAEVFEGEPAQMGYGIVNGVSARTDRVEEFSKR